MPLGIVAGVFTCILWGLTFIAPRAVVPFTAWDIAVARYETFGIASILLMAFPRFRPRGLPARSWMLGLLLGGGGYVGYFVSVAYAVKLAGAAIPPLIVGLMPVLLAILANRRDRSVSWKALSGPLCLIVLGFALVNATTLGATDAAHRPALWLGILSAVIALVVWMIYGTINSAVMRAPDAPDGLRWTGLQGLGAAIGSACFLPLTSFVHPLSASPAEVTRFALWATGMGLAGSWLATWLWVIACRRLPLALAAQLIVAETVFGLLFGFLYEGRLPSVVEAIGAALQVAGVIASISVFSGRAAEIRAVEEPGPA